MEIHLPLISHQFPFAFLTGQGYIRTYSTYSQIHHYLPHFPLHCAFTGCLLSKKDLMALGRKFFLDSLFPPLLSIHVRPRGYKASGDATFKSPQMMRQWSMPFSSPHKGSIAATGPVQLMDFRPVITSLSIEMGSIFNYLELATRFLH